MLPVYWVAQTGKIPSDLAQQFSSTVYGAEEEISGGVYGVIGVSGKLICWSMPTLPPPAGLVALVCAVCLVGVLVSMFKRSKTQRRGRNIDESSPLLH